MAIAAEWKVQGVDADAGGGAVSSEDRVCANCGHKNRRHHAFCRSCGVRLEAGGVGLAEETGGVSGERRKAEAPSGVSGERSKAAGGGIRPWLVGLGVLLIVAPFLTLAVLLTVRIVDEGEVGVVYMFGEVDPEPRPPGLHFKLPWASMAKMNVETQQFTVSAAADEFDPLAYKTVQALTYEGLTIGVDITVRFRLEAARAPAPTLFGQEFGVGPPDSPGTFALHYWLFENPAGQFAAFNPAESCPEMPQSGGGSSSLIWIIPVMAAIVLGGSGLGLLRMRRNVA